MQSDTSTGGQGRGQIRSALDAAAPASRIKGDLVVGTMASGASIAIPYVAVKGARPGPCLWVNGQVHGVEINGILAALDFVNGLDPQAMTGTVIVTGTANPLAFDARRKAAPQDDNDPEGSPCPNQGGGGDCGEGPLRRLMHRRQGPLRRLLGR